MAQLIQWDSLELRIDGAKLNELAASFRVAPIETLQLRFGNGLLRVEGTLRRIVSIPFTVEIAEIGAAKSRVRVVVRNASTFAGLPIPRFLFGLVKERLPRELVDFEPPATFVVALERFLPTFVSADIEAIRIIDGGLAVTIGQGGADVPHHLLPEQK